MWRSQAGHSVANKQVEDDDDWDTDPNFVNDVSEKESRWGSKTVEGSGRQEALRCVSFPSVLLFIHVENV